MTFEEYKAEAFAIEDAYKLLKFMQKHSKEFGYDNVVGDRMNAMMKERTKAENGIYDSVDVWKLK